MCSITILAFDFSGFLSTRIVFLFLFSRVNSEVSELKVILIASYDTFLLSEILK